jgi:hypothetical protein
MNTQSDLVNSRVRFSIVVKERSTRFHFGIHEEASPLPTGADCKHQPENMAPGGKWFAGIKSVAPSGSPAEFRSESLNFQRFLIFDSAGDQGVYRHAEYGPQICSIQRSKSPWSSNSLSLS